MTTAPTPSPAAVPSPLHDRSGDALRERLAIMIAVYATVRILLSPGLPLIVANDSMGYWRMAEIHAGQRSATEWYYDRTPGYPYFLMATAKAIGATPSAFILSTTFVGILGTACLAWVLARQFSNWAAAAFLLLMLLDPWSFGYEHVLLTETLSCAIIAGAIGLCVLRLRSAVLHGLLIGTVLGLGYMVRQTAVALVAPCVVAVAMHHPTWRRRAIVLLLAAIFAAGGFAGMTRRWSLEAARQGAPGADLLLFIGAANYGLIEPSLPEFAPARPAYEPVLASGPPAEDVGYTDAKIMTTRMVARQAFSEKQGSIAVQSLMRHPLKYAGAVFKNLRLFYECSNTPSENAFWPLAGMAREYPNYGNLRVSPEFAAQASGIFEQRFEQGAVARTYYWLIRPMRGALIAAAALSLLGAAIMLWRRDWLRAVLCLTPHYFILLHALLLTGIDRYAFPAYPAIFAAACGTIVYLARSFRGRNSAEAHRPMEVEPTGYRDHPAVVVAILATVLVLQLFSNFVLQPIGP